MNLGTKIKQIRMDAGITQQQLADMIFKSKRTVEMYESNKIDISIRTLQDISKALNTSMLNILVDDPSELLSILKEYYHLEDKEGYNMEKDFSLLMKGFIDRYKKT